MTSRTGVRDRLSWWLLRVAFAHLSPGQADRFRAVFQDAVVYRWPDGDYCADCRPGQECDDHVYDRGLAESFADLAAELGVDL